jgi:bifunctional UDP-N-acetylglucosamine pyrophosphorylase/glucosamine-1-phosphate N-acetyltransferase
MRSETISEAVVLAAGEGTRLRPLTYTRPKVLIPIANSPFIEHQLRLLDSLGIERVVLITGYMREMISDWVDSVSGLDMEVVMRVQREARGTADAIRTAEGSVEGRFLVLNGDVILDRGSLAKMLEGKTTSVGAKAVPNPRDYGVFEIRDGLVRRVLEKADSPPSNLANVGSYIFGPSIFGRIRETPPNPVRREIEITDTLQAIIDSGEPVRCHEVEEWFELGKPWDILGLNETFLAGGRMPGGRAEEGARDVDVNIGDGSVVEAGARVLGPSVIGEECTVATGSVVGPFSSIGNGVTVDGARVEGSVILEGSIIGGGSTVEYAVMGAGCSVGPGAKLLGRSRDGRGVRMEIKGQRLDSGRVSLGPILGDRCVIGARGKIGPGVTLDPDTEIEPGDEI